MSVAATAMTEAGVATLPSQSSVGGGGGEGETPYVCTASHEGEGEGSGREGEGEREEEGMEGVPQHYRTTIVTTGNAASTVAPNDMHVSDDLHVTCMYMYMYLYICVALVQFGCYRH